MSVTNACNAACLFCVNGETGQYCGLVDPVQFSTVLETIKENVGGVSITGGEPMLHPELVDELIAVADRVLGQDIEIDIVTNGTALAALAGLKQIDRLTSIHISRHHYDDSINSQLMQHSAPTAEDLLRFMASIPSIIPSG